MLAARENRLNCLRAWNVSTRALLIGQLAGHLVNPMRSNRAQFGGGTVAFVATVEEHLLSALRPYQRECFPGSTAVVEHESHIGYRRSVSNRPLRARKALVQLVQRHIVATLAAARRYSQNRKFGGDQANEQQNDVIARPL